ncbi:uncharacterized protein [Malus domestica]|uniref:uncharacterized protein n=1 Tax=Malus domestica TaxID=3750 RepID=UPI00397582D9
MTEDNSLGSEVESSHVISSMTVHEVDVNPNQRLSLVVLNEFNYLPWSRAVSLALGGRSKLVFINGSIKLWEAVKEMYGSQNNVARVFQLKKDISDLQQNGKLFVQLLGSMKSMWNELEIYRPHTTDAALLRKRAEEDKIFQLLSSLDSTYEDLQCHILMNNELPSFTSVCATIQREKVRRKVKIMGIMASVPEARAYLTNKRKYKGKHLNLKCQHCNNIGHVKDTCWILHPELKPDFMKDNKGLQRVNRKKGGAGIDRADNIAEGNTTALLGKFAGFLADTKPVPQENMQDSGATNHMTNHVSKSQKFEKFTNPSQVSIANGESVKVLGKEKIKIMSDEIESMALYVPSFPFQLLSVGKITNTLNCLAIFSPHNVIFQDCATKKTIGEGFYLEGLYYISKAIPEGSKPSSIPFKIINCGINV